MSANRVQLVHWQESEARVRVQELRAAGFRVVHEREAVAALQRAGADPPDAIVIDLTRLPSHARAFARALREKKKTRPVPLVFAGGEPEKVERVRKLLPDATFTAWKGIARALERAIAHPPAQPFVPENEHYYAGRSLAQKLGVKPASKLALIGAPGGFDAGRTLGELPAGVRLGKRLPADMVLWFIHSKKDLQGGIARMVATARAGSALWLAWPKKSGALETDLTEKEVRSVALARDLVDFKICAVDADWTGMRFAPRRTEEKRSKER